MTPAAPGEIAQRLAAVKASVARACRDAGRDPAEVTLVAVSKKQPLEAMLAAYEAGQRVFGENYVQEGAGKAREFLARGLDARIRFIGGLQKNKARDAAQFFAAVETLDSAELAAKLEAQCVRFGRRLEVLLEINYGEAQKSGLDWPEADALLRRAGEFPHLNFAGLMCIPPPRVDAALSRADFLALRDGMAALRARLPAAPNVDLRTLSMGMSHDYRIAIACGATEVRVGTAIFGPRA